MKKKIELIMAVCLVIAAFFLGSQSAILVQNSHIDTKGTPDTDSAHNTELTGDTGQTSSPSGNLSIVIDAGHGGIDPGKVGTNDALEKDINLALALKLRDKFKQDSIRIILTRDSDIGLYSEGNTNKKAEDMQNRCKIITEAAPILRSACTRTVIRLRKSAVHRYFILVSRRMEKNWQIRSRTA